ncbi:dynactin subunit 4 isoform X2 [Athalia rosae]|nr:dynactin subunit 4 isoform X2 [Athalia rosae]
MNCFDCPCCFQTLSTRAAPAPVRTAGNQNKEDAAPTPKKVYYLSCSFCRWTSRDAGIPDQFVATGGWPEQENPHSSCIGALIEYHRILGSKERQQCERKKFYPKRTFMQFEKFGMSSVMIRKRAGLRPPSESQSSDYPLPAIASEDVEELSPDIFTRPLDITKITTLEQRLKYPEVQAEEMTNLRPKHKQFLVKRSQRCRVCEHNVCKPEKSPQSIKFKIQLAAFYHVPEVRIVTCEPLRIGQSSELLLKLCNPTQHQTQIMLFPISSPTTPTTTTAVGIKQNVDRENLQMGCESPNLLPSLVRQVAITEDPKPIKLEPEAEITLPESTLILPPRDDAAEYDDTGDTHNFQDDPKLVVWRKGNKAVIRLHVKPNEAQQLEEGQDITVGFVMQYEYVNTIATLEHKEPQKLDLKIKLFLSIGKLLGST